MSRKANRQGSSGKAGEGMRDKGRTAGGPVNDTYIVYVGTYARADEPGIYVYELDMGSGELRLLNTQSGILNPSYLELDEGHNRLLAVSEATDESGQLVLYSIDKDSGGLTEETSASTRGAAPCYVQLDETGDFAVVANYFGENIALFSIRDADDADDADDAGAEVEAGEPQRVHQSHSHAGEARAKSTVLYLEQSISHQGRSVNEERQQGPHPHSTVIHPSGKYVYVQDLGTDEIVIYKLDTTNKQLVLHGTVAAKPGSGPRHLVFHPTSRYAYVTNELDSTVTAFSVDAESGLLMHVETVPTLPQTYMGTSFAADIHISRDGAFLYASNRGHDSIAVFRIDLQSGRLIGTGFVSTQGSYPRNFSLTPDGSLMLVANQLGDSIVTYRMNPDTGMPIATGQMTAVPRPVCIRFWN
ncbi:lactonase family protein [Alicyclobacillus curvatus]|nr:lactonase family protein [Alicyclobacillus curvatus]